MPQYYNGADPVTSFTDGLARGFELVEGIRERRQLRELRERESARADEALQLQRNQDARAQESSELSNQESRLRLGTLPTLLQQQVDSGKLSIDAARQQYERNPELFRQQDEAFKLSQQQGKQQLEAGKFALDNAKEAKAATADYVDNALIPSMTPSPLAQVARAGAVPGAQPTAQPANYVERAPAQVAPAQTPAAAGPVDLRTVPGPLEAAGNAVKGAAGFVVDKAKQYNDWYNKSNWERAGTTNNPLDYSMRDEPQKRFTQYTSIRDKLSPAARTNWDTTMKAAMTDELKALPNTPKNAPRIREINDQLKQLDRAQLDSLKTDVRRPVSPSDPKVEQALAPFQPTPGELPMVTQDQMRVINAQLARTSGAAKVDGNQLKAIARARKAGVIDDATLNNWRQFGGPLAPAAPKYMSVTGGFLQIMPNGGATFVSTGSGKGSKEAAEKSRAALAGAADLFRSEAAAGRLDIPKGAELSAVVDGLNTLRIGTNAREFQEKTGYNVLTEDGKDIDPSFLSTPGGLNAFAEMVTRAKAGITDPRESARVPDGAPEAVSSLPAAPTGLYPGYVDPESGMTYVGPQGGSGKDRSHWR